VDNHTYRCTGKCAIPGGNFFAEPPGCHRCTQLTVYATAIHNPKNAYLVLFCTHPVMHIAVDCAAYRPVSRTFVVYKRVTAVHNCIKFALHKKEIWGYPLIHSPNSSRSLFKNYKYYKLLDGY
jgi:hypothetical protein